MNELVKTIAIKGGYGYGNFGDDALMAAVHKIAMSLCRPGETGYLCKDAPYVRAFSPDVPVLALRDRDHLSVSMLLFGGGTQFYSFPRTAGGKPGLADRAIRLLKQPHRLPLKVAWRIVQTHQKEFPDRVDSIAAMGVGIGPFVAGSPKETQTRDLFARMTYVSVRDIKSYEICRRWGVTNLHHHTDLCFWPGFHAAYVPSVEPTTTCAIKRVGLIVRDWPHDERGDSYHRNLLAVAEQLSQNGKTVDFVLIAGRNDRVWLQRLKRTRFKTVLWTPETDTIRSFMAKLASYDLFITARYHGAVFATLLDKPSICIEVEPKLSLFADALGQAGRCWKYPFDASECCRLVGEIETGMPRITALLQSVKQHHCVTATQMVDSFLEFARPRLARQEKAGTQR